MNNTLRQALLKGVVVGTLAISTIAPYLASPAAAQSYTWQNVKIGGSGYVTGILAHPSQQGLFYARTDVGGAYKYNASTSKWIPLNDWTSSANSNLEGVDAIAIDRNNTNMFYMVVGEYYNGSNGAVLISSNQGASFTQVPLSFPTGANWGGRQVGERLQVDPNVGSILFYGTGNSSNNASTNGLWKSTDSGHTWTKVTGFPALSSDDTGAGISFVAFYQPSGSQNHATQTIFAGVNTQSAANAGTILYKSTNGGNTWSPVTNGVTGELPQRGQIGSDGNLYITYSSPQTYSGSTHYGPDGLYNGQVWKYNITGNAWTQITPPNDSQGGTSNYGFAGLSVDPAHPGVVAVTTMDRYDSEGETLFRTTNGGASWVDVGLHASFDTSAAPWIATDSAVHNLGNWADVALDPFNQDHAFATFGGGAWVTNNLTTSASGGTVNYSLAGENGIEETVINAVISPTANQYGSVAVLSSDGDVCGFAHTSVNQAPSVKFTNLYCNWGTSLDWAKNNSALVVRVGQANGASAGSISYNGGYSWVPFNSQGGSTSGGGQVAANADGSAYLWSPSDVAPVLSTNNAYAWTSLPLPKGSLVAADGNSATNLFAYDPATGTFYTSTDKGSTWATTATGLTQWGGQIIAPYGRQCDIWLSTWNGLFHNTGCGWGAWTQISGVAKATAVGFGAPATGQWYPTIYMLGTINGVNGVYRSTNIGASWVQINDSQHQYGGIYSITGDPKTFGTVYMGTNGRGAIVGTSPN